MKAFHSIVAVIVLVALFTVQSSPTPASDALNRLTLELNQKGITSEIIQKAFLQFQEHQRNPGAPQPEMERFLQALETSQLSPDEMKLALMQMEQSNAQNRFQLQKRDLGNASSAGAAATVTPVSAPAVAQTPNAPLAGSPNVDELNNAVKLIREKISPQLVNEALAELKSNPMSDSDPKFASTHPKNVELYNSMRALGISDNTLKQLASLSSS